MIFTKQIYIDTPLSSFNYDLNDIPIIEVIRITNELWGRIDTIINKYYSGRMEYLKILLDFNKMHSV